MTKSYPYLKITEDILNHYNVNYNSSFDENKQGYFTIPAKQSYKGITYRIPGDFSSAAFIIVAAALNPFPYVVKIRNIKIKSPQGDKRIIEILQKIGADITINEEKEKIYIKGGKYLDGFEYDCSQTPASRKKPHSRTIQGSH